MGKAAILIDDAIKTGLEREASLSGATPSSIAEAAIDNYLRRRTGRRDAIEAALLEAEDGAFVSKEAVDRWVASWGSGAELAEPEPDVFIKRER